MEYGFLQRIRILGELLSVWFVVSIIAIPLTSMSIKLSDDRWKRMVIRAIRCEYRIVRKNLNHGIPKVFTSKTGEWYKRLRKELGSSFAYICSLEIMYLS